eukprot:897456-Pyramimonas_sp.AAC.1
MCRRTLCPSLFPIIAPRPPSLISWVGPPTSPRPYKVVMQQAGNVMGLGSAFIRVMGCHGPRLRACPDLR